MKEEGDTHIWPDGSVNFFLILVVVLPLRETMHIKTIQLD